MENNPPNPTTGRSRGESSWTTLVGQQIGDFEILREIGRGGMGTVYQARQKSLDRIVALKVLSQGLASTPMSVVRFQREAQAAARLHHSNIVPIHSLGDQDGIYYYAMELVHGENLHDLIDRERRERSGFTEVAETAPLKRSGDPDETVVFTPAPSPKVGDSRGSVGKSGSGFRAGSRFERIARLMASVADALDYAHENGIIHRDVKPHNLILGEDGRTHIFDFGLARVLEQPGVTMTGEFIGSPLYMSPEQILGGQVRVDKRTDIYSLGATLYEWLTLSPPFPGETREQVISKIVSSEPTAPRERDTLIPVDLETICLKCLEKNPDRRYPSASDLRDDLLRFLDQETIKARRAGPLTQVRKFLLRNRVAAVAVMALAVIAVLVAALVQQGRRSRGKEQQLAEARQQVKALSEAPAETNEDILRQRLAAGESVASQLVPFVQSMLSSSAAGAEGEVKADPTVQPLSKALVAWLREREMRNPGAPVGPMEGATQELYLRALAAKDPAETARLALEFAQSNPQDPRTVMLSAVLACARKDFYGLMTHAVTALSTDPGKADGHLLAGVAKIMVDNPGDAVNDLNRAVELAPESTWPLTLRGLAYSRADDFQKAIADLSAAVRVAPENSLALLEKARISVASLGDYQTAILSVDRLIALDSSNADAYEFRGDCHMALKDYAAAQADFQQAILLGKVGVATVLKLTQATSLFTAGEAAKAQPAPTALPLPGGELPAPGSRGDAGEPDPERRSSKDSARFNGFGSWDRGSRSTDRRPFMASCAWSAFALGLR